MRDLVVVRYRLSEGFERLGPLVEFRQRVAEHVVRLPEFLGLGLEAQRLLRGGQRILILPQFVLHVAEVGVQDRRIRLGAHRLPGRVERFGQLRQADVSVREISVGV